MALRRRESLVGMVEDKEEKLAAAKSEADELRKEMRNMASLAARRARTLQQELQDALAETELGAASQREELVVVREQLHILSVELRDVELSGSHLFSIEALRYRIHQSRGCRKLLRRWCRWSVLRRQSQIISQRFIGSNLSAESRSERRALNAWIAAATTRSEQLRRISRAVAAFRFHGVRACLNSWIAAADALTQCRRRLRMGVTAFRNVGLRRAWMSWVYASASSQRLQRLGASLSPHGRATRRALNSWTALVHARTALRYALGALRMRTERRALNSWRAMWRRRVIMLRRLSRVLAAITKRRERLAFNSWRGASKVQSEQGRIVRRALAFMPEGRAKRRALNSWAALVRVRAALMHALGALRMRAERRGFNSWAAAVYEKMGRARLLRHALVSLSPAGRARRRALNSWREMADRRVTILRRLSRVLTAITRRRERLAFNSWAGATKVQVEQGYIVRRALAFMPEGRAKRRALNSWAALVRVRAALRYAITALTRRAERHALNSWTVMARTKRQQARTMKRALSSLSREGRSKRRALNSWIMMAAQRMTLLRSMETQRRAKLRSVAALTHQGERTGFNAWRSGAQARSGQLRRVSRAVAAFRFHGVRLCLNSWMARASGLARCHQLLRKGLSALQTCNFHRAWVSWTYAAGANLFMLRGVTAFTSRSERKCMNAWMAAAKTRSEQLGMIGRAVAAFRFHGNRACFNSWIAHSSAQARLNRLIRKGLSALQGSSYRRVFLLWAGRETTSDTQPTPSRRRVSFDPNVEAALLQESLRTPPSGESRSFSRARADALRTGSPGQPSPPLPSKSRLLGVSPLLRRGLNMWIDRIIKPVTATRLIQRRRWLRSVRLAFLMWQFARYMDHAEGVFRELLNRRTSSLKASLAARNSELVELRAALDEAHQAAGEDRSDAMKRAQLAVKAAQEAAQAAAEEQARALTKAHEREREEWQAGLQHEIDAALAPERQAMAIAKHEQLRMEKQALTKAHEREREEWQAGLQHELDAALASERQAMATAKSEQVRMEKQAFMEEHLERDRARDLEINSLRLKLGLSNSNMCRLLVDKANANDVKMMQRIESPSQSLHSLTARGRVDPRSPSPRSNPPRGNPRTGKGPKLY